MQVIENEIHFLLECPLYTDHRNILLQVCDMKLEDFRNMEQEVQFNEILKSKDDRIITALGKYLHNSMTKHYWSNPNAPPNRKCKRHRTEKQTTKTSILCANI